MNDGRKALHIVGAIALTLGGVGLGYVSAQPAQGPDSPMPVTVTAIYDEDGTLYDLTVSRDGQPVDVAGVREKWRGNDDAADGLYNADPYDPTRDQVNVSITYGPDGEADSVELTDSDGNDVPVGSVAETWADDNADTEEE